MATINEIQNVAGYRGDAALGGGNLGVIQLDLQPWQRLADYTFLKNRADYESRQKEFANAISTASKDLAVDWSKILPVHRDEILKEKEALRSFAASHPDSWSQQSPYFAELQQKKNDFLEKVNGAIGRGLEYEVALKQAEGSSQSPYDLDEYKKSLDGKIGGIYDRIEPFSKFELTPQNLSVGTQKIINDRALPNYIETNSEGVLDLPSLGVVAEQMNFDDALRPGSGQMQIYRGMADNLNGIVTQLKNDPRMVTKDQAGNPQAFTAYARNNGTIGQIIRDGEAYNAEVARYNQLNPDTPVLPINIMDGVDDYEVKQLLVFKASVANNKAVDREQSLKYTGDQTKRDLEAMQQRGQTARLREEIAARAQKGDTYAQQLTTDADTFANRIFSQVQAGNTDGRRAISVNALSEEEKSVLGISNTDKEGKRTSPFGEESKLYLYVGPNGGMALAERSKNGEYKTKTSYSRDGLKSARITFALKQGSGKEYGAYGELNQGGLPAPVLSSSTQSTSGTMTQAQQFLQSLNNR